jgi:hypothetical protein
MSIFATKKVPPPLPLSVHSSGRVNVNVNSSANILGLASTINIPVGPDWWNREGLTAPLPKAEPVPPPQPTGTCDVCGLPGVIRPLTYYGHPESWNGCGECAKLPYLIVKDNSQP